MKTSIEWTDFSINPLRAKLNGKTGHYCEKISAGCKNCYSSRLQPRFGMPQFQEQRSVDVEHLLDTKRLIQVLRRTTPTKYFWCTMTDMFGDWVPFEWIAACFGAMAATPHHIHQVLTKRPDRALEFFRWLAETSQDLPDLVGEDCPPETSVEASACVMTLTRQLGDPPEFSRLFARGFNRSPWPLRNVWLGASAENEEQLRKREEYLARCPAAVRWFSLEPLLGPVNLALLGTAPKDWGVGYRPLSSVFHWYVVGGESGHGARECKLEWIESVVRQCKDDDVPVFVKQLGAKPIGVGLDRIVPYETPYPIRHTKGGDVAEFPVHLRVRQFPGDT